MIMDMRAVVERVSSHIGYHSKLPEKKNEFQIVNPVRRDFASEYEGRFRSDFADWVNYWTLTRGQKPCVL
jgi:sigma54-dependent transcription regulator